MEHPNVTHKNLEKYDFKNYIRPSLFVIYIVTVTRRSDPTASLSNWRAPIRGYTEDFLCGARLRSLDERALQQSLRQAYSRTSPFHHYARCVQKKKKKHPRPALQLVIGGKPRCLPRIDHADVSREQLRCLADLVEEDPLRRGPEMR